MTQTGSRTTVLSKMELLVTIFDNFHYLTIATKIFILDISGVLDPTLITDSHLSTLISLHFRFPELDLNKFETNFSLYKNRSINSYGKEDGYEMRIY